MEYILSLSYGKDSVACLGAIEHLGWPLDRIVTADVWATDTIPADLPPMMEFKAEADRIIKTRYGVTVEHVRHKLSYEDMFYRPICRGPKEGILKGFPLTRKANSWCKNLKVKNQIGRGGITYLGIASDELERIERHCCRPGVKLPLVELGWEEDYCGLWAQHSGLLSPIYTTETRGGCWFCHNQGVGQLRRLRKNYPDYWALMLKWDADSPVTFKTDGHTVHDFDRRFQLEDEGLLSPDDRIFRWSMLNDKLNYRLF